MHLNYVAYALAGLYSAASANEESNKSHIIDPVSRFSDMDLALPSSDFPVLQSSFETPPDCGEQSYHGTGRLRGLKALITGGDSGIGRAVAIAYAREGAQIAINYLPEEQSDAQDLVDLLETEGLAVQLIPGDLLSEKFCTELVQEAHSRLGGLDILVNHAGYSGYIDGPKSQPISNHSTAQLEQIFRTNVFAGFFLTRAAVPYLPRGGSIIFTTSAMVSSPLSTAVDYGASKAAIAHMVRSLALQLVEQGIRVNGIAPGFTYTPFIVSGGYTTETMNSVADAMPFGRMEQPVELAPLYVNVAEPDKTFVSGEVFAAAGASPGL